MPIYGRRNSRRFHRDLTDALRRHAAPPTPHYQRTNLFVAPASSHGEDDVAGTTGHTSYTHLIEGDLAPVGRVHLVGLGPDVGDQRENHFLVEMDADSNMGAKRLRERSRRGPFKTSSGRSTILSHSAHVEYRRRGNGIEVTVRRGVTDKELETLMSKLRAHAVGKVESFLYIIKGGRRKKIGRIGAVSFTKLRLRIDEALEKYRTVGLLVQDSITRGILHKSSTHNMKTAQNLRDVFDIEAGNLRF